MTQVLPDDEAYFSELLKGWGVQASVQQVLKERGFLTLSLLAHAVPAEANVEGFLVALLGRPSGHPPDQPLFSAEASSLRRALKVFELRGVCHACCCPAQFRRSI